MKTFKSLSSDNFKQVLDRMFEPVFLIDSRGCFLDVNIAFADMLDYRAKEMVAMHFADITFAPDHFNKIEQSVQKDILNFELYYFTLAEKKSMPITLIARSGRYIPVLLRSLIVRDDSGGITEALGMISREARLPAPPSSKEDAGLQKVWGMEQNYRSILENSGEAIIITELEQKVGDRTRDLEEANTALRVLLKNRDEERLGIEKKLMTQINALVLPYIEKLQASGLKERQKTLLEVLSTNLENIFSPFETANTTQNIYFTPMETQVANLVKNGKTTKAIAELLNISVKTVEFHRDKIRKKLGIRNQKTGLRNYLQS